MERAEANSPIADKDTPSVPISATYGVLTNPDVEKPVRNEANTYAHGKIVLHIHDATFVLLPGKTFGLVAPDVWSYPKSLTNEDAQDILTDLKKKLPDHIRLREAGEKLITTALLAGQDKEIAVPIWRLSSNASLAIEHLSENGLYNASKALDYLDSLVLEPYALFSFNQKVGQRTLESGFIEGTIFSGNGYAQDVGGGVCASSTIVHQAVAQLGLPILERHHHSLPVKYAETGKDATVYYGVLDYRFRNGEHHLLFEKIRTPERLGLRFWLAIH
ncbi:VanW like protein [Heliophilum fasciatum]|uniref:VanW like protein n=2 Tax=Heliophilum fasciatum TaxID=35700 RepID=A0A4R2RLK9_9FIRM|nr:VanW like protein [Heliophilum fasciatum]